MAIKDMIGERDEGERFGWALLNKAKKSCAYMLDLLKNRKMM